MPKFSNSKIKRPKSEEKLENGGRLGRALSNMLTAGEIAPAIEQIASPVTGICPRSENLKLYVNYVPCKPLAWIKLLVWNMG